MGCVIVILLLVIILILIGPGLLALGGFISLKEKVDSLTANWGILEWAIVFVISMAYLLWWANRQVQRLTARVTPQQTQSSAVSTTTPQSVKQWQTGPVQTALPKDYRRWTAEQWKAWKQKHQNDPPLPDEVELWTDADRDRWEKSEWLRLLEEDKAARRRKRKAH